MLLAVLVFVTEILNAWDMRAREGENEREILLNIFVGLVVSIASTNGDDLKFPLFVSHWL